MTSDAEHNEWLLRNVYTFNEHKREFQKIKTLEWIKADPPRCAGVPDDLLRLRLGRIVYRCRGRYQDPQYYENIGSCIDDAREAGALALRLSENWAKIDEGHLDAFQSCLRPLMKIDPAPSDLRLYFLKVSHMLSSCAAALSVAAIGGPKSGQGRPLSRHVIVTVELIDAWRDLTGQPIRSPKGQTRGKKGEIESPQASTQFIFLALRMLDPQATVSNAQSSIKLALKYGEGYKKDVQLAMGDPALFMAALRRSVEEEEARQKQKRDAQKS